MFSVIIPLYNKGGLIRSAIQSVLAQTFQDFEIIVVNDGSTDHGANEVLSIQDSRVKLIQQRNQGVSCARNNGVQHCSGSHICFLDADDLWLPEHLQCLNELIHAVPNAGLYATNYRRIDPYGGTYSPKFTGDRISVCEDIFRWEMEESPFALLTNSICIPREIFCSEGGFTPGERVGEDTSLWYRIASHRPIALIDQVTSIYRLEHSDTIRSNGSMNPDWSFLAYYKEVVASASDIPPERKHSITRFVDRYYQSLTRHALLAGNRQEAHQHFRQVRYSVSSKKAYWVTLLCFLLPHKILAFLCKRRKKS